MAGAVMESSRLRQRQPAGERPRGGHRVPSRDRSACDRDRGHMHVVAIGEKNAGNPFWGKGPLPLPPSLIRHPQF